MNTYIITVREVTYRDLKIRAESKQEACDLIGMADDEVVKWHSSSFDVLQTEEIES